ncbi:MAG TPA: hypothetical protein VKF40_19430 [Burkholderiales bacterium]|nr:hypothetical protein [Burkholderiales bacterium]
MPRKLTAIVIAALLLLSAFAYPAYRGSTASFLLFDLSFVAMLSLALPRPRSHVYIFFAVMLFLGFWLKLILHMITGANLLEPVGFFSDNSEAWDRTLEVASVAAIGVAAARLLHLACGARAGAWETVSPDPVPSWYSGWRVMIWGASTLALLTLSLLNFQVAFFQAGVNPRLILPYHINVLAGWMINIGFALWFAVLIHWEFQNSARDLARMLVFPIIEGLVSSASALSRSLFFLHTIPYLFTVASDWTKKRGMLSRRALIGLALSWTVCFAISLTLVSWFRINIFQLAYQPALVAVPGQTEIATKPIAGATMSNQIKPALIQVSRLFVDRWIGLEGVMAVSSYPDLGFGLLADALGSPKRDNASLYQTIAKSGYESSERFTFATLPGIAGVLFYSGSLAAVGLGTLLVTLLMIGTELAALRFTGNPFFTSLAALGMANVACQMTFPYLSMIFLLQLWVAVVFVCALQRWRLHPVLAR